MTTTAQSAHADQLAAELRDRKSFHDGIRCDAFDPCDSCRVARRAVQVMRHLAEVPAMPVVPTVVPVQRRPVRLGVFARKA